MSTAFGADATHSGVSAHDTGLITGQKRELRGLRSRHLATIESQRRGAVILTVAFQLFLAFFYSIAPLGPYPLIYAWQWLPIILLPSMHWRVKPGLKAFIVLSALGIIADITWHVYLIVMAETDCRYGNLENLSIPNQACVDTRRVLSTLLVLLHLVSHVPLLFYVNRWYKSVDEQEFRFDHPEYATMCDTEDVELGTAVPGLEATPRDLPPSYSARDVAQPQADSPVEPEGTPAEPEGTPAVATAAAGADLTTPAPPATGQDASPDVTLT